MWTILDLMICCLLELTPFSLLYNIFALKAPMPTNEVSIFKLIIEEHLETISN